MRDLASSVMSAIISRPRAARASEPSAVSALNRPPDEITETQASRNSLIESVGTSERLTAIPFPTHRTEAA
jgi:hypothetical protein